MGRVLGILAVGLLLFAATAPAAQAQFCGMGVCNTVYGQDGKFDGYMCANQPGPHPALVCQASTYYCEYVTCKITRITTESGQTVALARECDESPDLSGARSATTLTVVRPVVSTTAEQPVTDRAVKASVSMMADSDAAAHHLGRWLQRVAQQ